MSNQSRKSGNVTPSVPTWIRKDGSTIRMCNMDDEEIQDAVHHAAMQYNIYKAKAEKFDLLLLQLRNESTRRVNTAIPSIIDINELKSTK